jgi:hypothetical protein
MPHDGRTNPSRNDYRSHRTSQPLSQRRDEPRLAAHNCACSRLRSRTPAASRTFSSHRFRTRSQGQPVRLSLFFRIPPPTETQIDGGHVLHARGKAVASGREVHEGARSGVLISCSGAPARDANTQGDRATEQASWQSAERDGGLRVLRGVRAELRALPVRAGSGV